MPQSRDRGRVLYKQTLTVRLEFAYTYLGIKSYRTSVTYPNLIFEAYRTYVPYL